MPLLLLPRRVLVVLGVIFLAPIFLHVFLWSRVVTVQCWHAPEKRVLCDVEEQSLAFSGGRQVDATGMLRAELRGAVHRSRGDTWIVLRDGSGGEKQLTSGFNGDKTHQRAVVDALNGFFAERTRPRLEMSFGSRWLTAYIFGGIYAFLLLVLYPLFGQRLRATADRARGTLELRRRLWPLPGKRVDVPLGRRVRFEVQRLPPRRFRLAVVTDDGQTHPLSWPVGVDSVLLPAATKLNVWAEEERARYGSAA